MKLFSEAVEEVEYICEEKEDGKKNYKIRGIFMQADIKNRNGRVYPMDVLQKEVNKYSKNFIEEKISFDGKNVICVPLFFDFPITLSGALASPFLNSI